MNRLTNNTIIQYLENPHAIRQAINVKESLTGRQPSFLTLTFYITFIYDIFVALIQKNPCAARLEDNILVVQGGDEVGMEKKRC